MTLSSGVVRRCQCLTGTELSPLVVGETSVLSNFALSGANLILNSENQATDFCQESDSKRGFPFILRIHQPGQ